MDREDIQSMVLQAQRRERFARYYLLTFGSGEPRRALTRLVADVSSADEAAGSGARCQCALAASGLRALGLTDAELAQFPREFRQGMAHPERALSNGDRAADSPEHWEFGGPNTPPIDALWLTFSDDAAYLEQLSAQYERLFARFGLSFLVHSVALNSPEPRSAPELGPRRRFKRVPYGEFVLGERDAVGERIRGPLVAIKHSARPMPAWVRTNNALDFGKNGSYLVVRKVLQSWFMRLNVDLRRQFEFERAEAQVSGPRSGRLHGGGYFFLPSVRALNYLAEGG
ncbi:MAG: hypothetical protein ABI488_08935 [Polyangiaceae bacterium]